MFWGLLGVGVTLMVGGIPIVVQAGDDAGTMAGSGLMAAGAVVILLAAHTGLRARASRAQQNESAVHSHVSLYLPSKATALPTPLSKLVEKELVDAIREGEELSDVFSGARYDEYICWNERTAAYVAEVLGAKAEDRFIRAAHSSSVEDAISQKVGALRELLDTVDASQITASEQVVQAAAKRRRTAPRDAISAARQAPQLSFGRPVIPAQSQVIRLSQKLEYPGRVIRVPVTNAHGAGTAEKVHALLHFMPDDIYRSFAPREKAQAQWFSEAGPEFEIDIPGNGRPRLLDVVVIIEEMFDHAGHAFEWTPHSRAAELRGYEIKASRFEVGVEVLGSGGHNAPRLAEALEVQFQDGLVAVDWLKPLASEATNRAPWSPQAGGY